MKQRTDGYHDCVALNRKCDFGLDAVIQSGRPEQSTRWSSQITKAQKKKEKNPPTKSLGPVPDQLRVLGRRAGRESIRLRVLAAAGDRWLGCWLHTTFAGSVRAQSKV